jgi:predicted O-methyltransferase YrrM
MNVLKTFIRMMRNSDRSVELLSATVARLDALIEGISNQSHLVNERLKEGTEGIANQTNLLNERLKEAIDEIANRSNLLNERLKEAIDGIANQSNLLNERLKECTEGIANQSNLLNQKLNEVTLGIANQSRILDEKLVAVIHRQDALLQLQHAQIRPASPAPAATLQDALALHPLMIDAKTYNTSHPAYNPELVRNFPGKILNFDKPSSNSVYRSLVKFAEGDNVSTNVWDSILGDALAEAKTVPHANQVFERRDYIEKYMSDIAAKYGAYYAAGWVNLDDALFLYWLVRQLKPKTIVQTGVCNGLSSAFMMLGLVKNGPEGKLHVIDLPPVFDPKDPAWTAKGKVYGVVIPEGKSSGWIVPDAYHDRFDVRTGDAKKLLPKLVDEIDSIDFFYHDSDHTYDHMTFEFREAKRKLKPGGLMIGDDISWNASLWDFADQYGVPSYNFKGAVGVAFF